MKSKHLSLQVKSILVTNTRFGTGRAGLCGGFPHTNKQFSVTPAGCPTIQLTSDTAAAAAAAKSLQSCPTLCDPIDGSSPGSAVPEILQARTLEWVAISFSTSDTTYLKIASDSWVMGSVLQNCYPPIPNAEASSKPRLSPVLLTGYRSDIPMTPSFLGSN